MNNIGLYEKIYNIMCESSGLKKDMSVANQYKAISEAAVLNEIKPLLKKHKVILFPIETEVSLDGKITQLTAKYKIVDVETGQFEILETVGNGADTQDKGSGKAWTYAYKCLIQKTFCLFSGEDTDNTHSKDIVEYVTTNQVIELSELMQETSTEEKAFFTYFKVSSLEKLNVDQYKQAKGMLEKKKEK